jgi:hypothetical protein
VRAEEVGGLHDQALPLTRRQLEIWLAEQVAMTTALRGWRSFNMRSPLLSYVSNGESLVRWHN